MQMKAMTLPESEPVVQRAYYETHSFPGDCIRLLQQVSDQAEQVGLVTLTLQFAEERRRFPSTTIEQSMQYIIKHLSSLVRKSDDVLLQGQRCSIVLHHADMQGTRIVQERLWEALLWAVHNMHEGGLQRPNAMEIGYSAYPDPASTLEECVHGALHPVMRFALQPERSFSTTSTPAVPATTSAQALPDGELPALARQLGIPYLPLLPRKLPARVQRLISPELARELQCYPLGRERDILTVAMSDPQNPQTLERLQHETGMRIFPVLTHPQELAIALEALSR